MALKAFTITFLNDADDHASFLYLDGNNSGKLRFTPNGQATIKPGTLTPWQNSTKFDPSGSVFYLFGLNTILSDEQIAGVQFDAGWASAYYDDAQNGRYWAFTANQQMTVNANDHADLPIARIAVGGANNLATTSLRVVYYNVDGLTAGGPQNHKTGHFSVALRSQPSLQPLPSLSDDLDCGFVDGHEMDHDGVPNAEWIRTSPPNADATTNAFTLQIQPKAGQPGVQAGSNTTLILSFVSGGDAFGALASPDDISRIRVNTGPGAERWTVTPVTDVPHPYWKVTIPSGCELSGHLSFENVVSRLEPGWTDFTLQYKGVPNYRDGQLVIKVYKYGPPVMQYASATITVTEDDSGYADSLSKATISVDWACYSIEKMRVELLSNNTYVMTLTSDGDEAGGLGTSLFAEVLSGAVRDPCQVRFSAIPLAFPFPTFAEGDSDYVPIETISVDWQTWYESNPHGGGGHGGWGGDGGPHGRGG